MGTSQVFGTSGMLTFLCRAGQVGCTVQNILTRRSCQVCKVHKGFCLCQVCQLSCFLQNILVAGKPHLGTDRLIRILQAFRKHLTALGVKIHFGSCVQDLEVQHDRVVGVKLKGTNAMLLTWLLG